jgi:hypothetical protein
LHQVFSEVLKELKNVIVGFGADSNDSYTSISGPLLLLPLNVLLELIIALISQDKHLL